MSALLLTALLACPAAALAPPDPDLAAGIRSTREGDFETAVLTLDGVVRRLATQGDRSADLAQASFHLGVAYLGLGQETLGQAKFRKALEQEPGFEPSPGAFSERVLRVFHETRRDFEEGKQIQKLAHRTPGKIPWLLLGAGGAGATGLAVALSRERANTLPTASFTFEPQGVAIVGVTDVLFRASATDPDGDPVRYRWNFGDGATAQGDIVSHRYQREGEMHVVVTVEDGIGSSEAAGTLTVGSLTGLWRISGQEVVGVTGFEVSQRNSQPAATLVTVWAVDVCYAMLIAPRQFGLTCGFGPDASSATTSAVLTFQGEVDASLQRISGTLECRGGWHSASANPCGFSNGPQDDRIQWPEVLVRD